MTAEELRNEIVGEIKNKLPEGHCVDMRVFVSKELEQHHIDMYWDRYLTWIYHYNGHLLYESIGGYTFNMADITSLDVLTSINDGMVPGRVVSISREAVRKLDNEYMHWGYKEWICQKHEFQYWLWDGKKKSGPFLILQEMTLDEARDYVKAKYKETKYRSFDLQEFNGRNNTYYNYGL